MTLISPDQLPTGACLVTGCAGFIGSHLTKSLLDMGLEVVGVDNFATGKLSNMDVFFEHSSCFTNIDIRQPDLIYTLKEMHLTLRCAFHLAAVVSVPWPIDHHDETLDTNHYIFVSC